jgi:hypothetical protein
MRKRPGSRQRRRDRRSSAVYYRVQGYFRLSIFEPDSRFVIYNLEDNDSNGPLTQVNVCPPLESKRFVVGPTIGQCGKHGPWYGPESCPRCPPIDPSAPRLVVTGVDNERGIVTYDWSDGE